MSENQDRSYIVDALRPLAAFPIENRIQAGTPDIVHKYGVIECKRLDSWPDRETSKINIGLRKDQKIWLRRWTHCGGSALVITTIGDEWLIHSGAWRYLADATVTEFRSHTMYRWERKPLKSTLRYRITECHKNRRSVAWESGKTDTKS